MLKLLSIQKWQWAVKNLCKSFFRQSILRIKINLCHSSSKVWQHLRKKPQLCTGIINNPAKIIFLNSQLSNHFEIPHEILHWIGKVGCTKFQLLLCKLEQIYKGYRKFRKLKCRGPVQTHFLSTKKKINRVC